MKPTESAEYFTHDEVRIKEGSIPDVLIVIHQEITLTLGRWEHREWEERANSKEAHS